MNTLFLMLALSLNSHADFDRLQMIDALPNGFKIFRMSQPDKKDVIELCKLGVKEIMSLNGKGDKVEVKRCPGMKVKYNIDQDSKVPLSSKFLSKFDSWVDRAKKNGIGIAFNCSCGCHRTGRLAAYYRMKYQEWTSHRAIDEMYEIGKLMIFYPHLDNQVLALEDYIFGRECSQKLKHCVPK